VKVGDLVEYHSTSDMSEKTLIGHAAILQKTYPEFSWMIVNTKGQKLMWNPESMRLINDEKR